MLSEHALHLLGLMGHGGSEEGAVSGDTLLAALNALESKVSNSEKVDAPTNPDAEDDNDEPDVGLSARASPLLEMLRHACKSDTYVMWRPD